MKQILIQCVLLALLARPILADAPMGTVAGTVRDPAGNPVPGAFLTLAVNLEINVHYSADAQGRYSIPVVANSPVGPLCASPGPAGTVYPSYGLMACSDRFTVAPGATLTLDLTLQPRAPGNPQTNGGPVSAPRGWITGRVTLAGSGNPVPGVTVQLATTPISTTTGPDGRYQFPAISTTDGQGGGPTYTVAVTPPSGYAVAGPASRQVTVQAGQGVEADFVLAPAFAPFWVESFVPNATIWSGPDSKAVAFGARPQWSHFLVAAPQQGPRLEVWDPLSTNYAWVDAAAVGPSGPPAP